MSRLKKLRDMKPQEIEDLQEEMARLRITDAEREAIKEAMEGYAEWMDDDGVLHQEAASTVATLRGLLERVK